MPTDVNKLPKEDIKQRDKKRANYDKTGQQYEQ
jgi:hypothetical protein